MPLNVEIKAQLQDAVHLKKMAEILSSSTGELIVQEDTFFKVPTGRLKLRVLQDKPAQLIFYERPDQDGPKVSDYQITEITNPQDLKTTLTKALGVRGEVCKHRMLYLVGQTRVHVDQVQGLGNFMELEVVLTDGQTAEEGENIADDLMEKLGILQEDLLEGAYIDLILQKHQNGSNSSREQQCTDPDDIEN